MFAQLTPNERKIRDLEFACTAIGRAIYTSIADLEATAWVTDEPVPFAERDQGRHLSVRPGQSWGKLWDCAWFHFTVRIPLEAGGQKIVLLIDLSGEGCVVDGNGSPVLGLASMSSSFDASLGSAEKRVVPLAYPAAGGEQIDVWVEAGCNDLFGGYRAGGSLREASIAIENQDLKALYYDFSVLLDLASAQPARSARRARILAALRKSAHKLSSFDEDEAREAREILRPELDKRGGSPSLFISATGQAHLDLAWLWPVRETIRKGGRTFATVLALMDRYPEYVFGASQPQLYQWIKGLYPDLYARVKERIAEGRWEPQGAMWVEADVNLTGGESLVRQLLYGKRFFQDEFGVDATVAWLPDDFGFPASLPQILKKSGAEYFLTTKLSWNANNRFPRHSFWWRGIDGSEILAHMPPEGTYNSAALPHSIRRLEESYEDKDVSGNALLLFGIGDGGGGPGEEHLERLARVRDLDGLPPVRQERSVEFFHRLAEESAGFRTWSGELYLERHQGTYTTQARAKRFNRKLELALRELEWIAVLAAELAGDPYPGDDLESIWKEILLYQFHDILPGSSISRVYQESTARYESLTVEVEGLTQSRAQRLASLAGHEGAADSVLVLNPLPWPRSEWLEINGRRHLIQDVPPLGYTVANMASGPTICPGLMAGNGLLENDQLRVGFGDDGAVLSVFDKDHEREVLAGPANKLVAYHDDGDAWDFAPDYREGPLQECRLHSVETLIDGPRAIARHQYRVGSSTIDQDVILTSGSRRLEFHTRVDWRERHTMLRTSFPVLVRAAEATRDIQFGSVKTPAHRNISWDEARDEVCAHKWVDLSQANYGVALLNDCKYGHRIRDNLIDLNLLRSPTTPDATADQGLHELAYAVYPHPGGPFDGGVVRSAYEFNVPLRWIEAEPAGPRRLPSNFSLFSVDAGNVMIETVKRAEDSDEIINRLYEWAGRDTRTTLRSGLEIGHAALTDLMERPIEQLPVREGGVELSLSAFEIVTVKVRVNGL